MKKTKVHLKGVSKELHDYWTEIKTTLNYTCAHKKKRISFTRPRGKILLRLRNNPRWRYPKGTQYHKGITCPSIGHRNSEKVRETVKAYGLKRVIFHNVEEYKKICYEKCLPTIARTVGNRKRKMILEVAKSLGTPIYFVK